MGGNKDRKRASPSCTLPPSLFSERCSKKSAIPQARNSAVTLQPQHAERREDARHSAGSPSEDTHGEDAKKRELSRQEKEANGYFGGKTRSSDDVNGLSTSLDTHKREKTVSLRRASWRAYASPEPAAWARAGGSGCPWLAYEEGGRETPLPASASPSDRAEAGCCPWAFSCSFGPFSEGASRDGAA